MKAQWRTVSIILLRHLVQKTPGGVLQHAAFFGCLLMASPTLAQAQTNLVPFWATSVASPAGGAMRSGAAAADDGTIYVTIDGQFDLASGTFTSPAYLHALRPDGSVAWTFAGTNGAASPPTIGPDGTVYYSVRQAPETLQTLFALEPSGGMKWVKHWDEQIDANLAVRIDNRMLAISTRGHLLTLEGFGQDTLVGLLDSFPPGREASAPVMAAGSSMYYGVGTPVIHAQDYRGGIVRAYAPGSIIAGLAIGPDGTVYLACNGGLLCAVNPDWTEQWRITRPAEIVSGPAIAQNGTIFLPTISTNGSTSQGELVRLSRYGEALGTNFFIGALKSTPALGADNTVWVTDTSGHLNLLSESGQVLGLYTADGLGAAPLVTRAGTAIATTTNGQVICFSSASAPTVGWPMLGRNPKRDHRDYTASPPSAPADMTASTNQTDRIDVGWTAADLSAVTFDVWRSLTTATNEATQVASFVPRLNWSDINALPGFTYYYWVRPLNGFGAGPWVGPVAGTLAVDDRVAWHYQVSTFRVVGTAIASDGSIYVTANNPSAAYPGTNNSRLVALDPSGRERWAVSFGDTLAEVPVVGANGHVYLTGKASVMAYGPDGTKLWEIIDGTPFQSPAIGSNDELFLLNQQHGFIISPSGATNWSSLDGSFSSPGLSSPPQVRGLGEVWFPVYNGVGLGVMPGSLIWANTKADGAAVGMAPAPGGGTYFINASGLHAFRSDGSGRWDLLGTNYSGGPVLGPDGSLYVGTRNPNNLLAIADDGRQLWSTTTDGTMASTPAVGQDGSLFVVTLSGNIQALNPDGSTRWRFGTGSPIRMAPNLSASGQLVVGNDAGIVWALRADTTLANSPWPKYQGDPANHGYFPQTATSEPVKPTNVLATVQSEGGTVIHLSWDSVPEAQRYEVWRSDSGILSNALPVATNLTLIAGFDDDLTRAGITYTYWVRGANQVGTGAFSRPVGASQTNQLWAVPVGGFAPVVAADGTVFASVWGNPFGAVAAYDPQGTQLWFYQEPAGTRGAPALGPNGILAFASETQGGSIRGLSSSTGRSMWLAALNARAPGDTAVDAYGTFYGLSWDFRLFAVGADGDPLWTCQNQGDSREHPVIGPDGTIYAQTPRLLVAKSPTGVVKWSLNSQYLRNWGPPAVSDNGDLVLFVSGPTRWFTRLSSEGVVVASNSLSGVRWQYQREPVLNSAGNSYFIADSCLICVDSNFTVVWTNQFRAASPNFGIADVPALDKAGNVYAAGQNELVVINSGGSRIGRLELGTTPTAPPVLTASGRLYMTGQGRLYALRAAAGLDTAAPWPMYRHDPAGTASQNVPTTPAAPTLLPQQPFANGVRIACTQPPFAVSLELFRSTTTNFQDAVRITTGHAGQSFADDLTAVPGIAYYYWARFQTPGGPGAFSGPVLGTAVEVPIKWFVDLPDALARAPAIAPDGSIFTCATNRLIALDPQGSFRWELPGLSGSPVVAPDGAIILRSGSNLFSLSGEGMTNWIIPSLSSYGLLMPSVGADGRILVSLLNDQITALSSSNSILWQLRYTNYYLKSPAIAADGSVLFMRNNTQMVRLDPDGSESRLLNVDYSQDVNAPILGADGSIYTFGIGNGLSATSPDGTNKWRLPAACSGQTAPVIAADGTVFVASCQRITAFTYTQKIEAVSPDGSTRWTFDIPFIAAPSLALSADGVLLVAIGANLIALAETDGRILWQMPSPNKQQLGPPILDYDGVCYVPVKGGLLALQLGAGPALSAWPMNRQNPRQSACLERAAIPQFGANYTKDGRINLQVLAPGGCVLLKSEDLRTWRRLGFQSQCTQPVSWEVDVDASGSGFFRIVSP